VDKRLNALVSVIRLTLGLWLFRPLFRCDSNCAEFSCTLGIFKDYVRLIVVVVETIRFVAIDLGEAYILRLLLDIYA
jgi:hypothetical protein